MRSYGGLLGRYRDDPTVWRALPGDVSAWWRRRSASTVELVSGAWTVVGPAAGEARIAFVD